MFSNHDELVKNRDERSRQASFRECSSGGKSKRADEFNGCLGSSQYWFSNAADTWVLVTRPLRKGFVQGHQVLGEGLWNLC